MNANVTTELNVNRISRESGVLVNDQWIGWDTLRAAASQDDVALAAVYSDVLRRAGEMARRQKMVTVGVHNLSGHVTDTAAYTWAAVASYMDGTPVGGRTIAADWGQTGSRTAALRDAAEARRVLTEKGYDVGGVR